MNKILTAMLTACVCLSVTFSAGCHARNYVFYTNIPESDYEIEDGHYKLGASIGGFNATEEEFEQIDTENYTSRRSSFYAMLAPAELVVADDFNAEGAELHYNRFAEEVRGVLHSIDNSLSSSVTSSDIAAFNSAEAGATLEISRITYEVLNESLEAYAFTEGYYNPALYYNVRAYCFGDKQLYPKFDSQLPSDEEVAVYTDIASHFEELILKEVEGSYYVTKPDYTVERNGETLSLKLDLGGIGKGYAVDKIDELFDEYGYKFGYFNFGTSSMLVKSNVTSGSFNMYFASPRAVEADALGYVKMKARNKKLSTSGDNVNYYTIDGVRYCHIIDPTTGKPVQKGIMSATIVGGGAAENDALTTAIMAMGKDKAISFIESKLTDRKVVFTCE